MTRFQVYLELLHAGVVASCGLAEHAEEALGNAFGDAVLKQLRKASKALGQAATHLEMACGDNYAQEVSYAIVAAQGDAQPEAKPLPKNALTKQERQANVPDEVPSHKQIG